MTDTKETKKEIYSLKEICEITGLSKWTIKLYQKKGLIPDHRNSFNNFRVFTVEDKDLIVSLIAGKNKNEQENA